MKYDEPFVFALPRSFVGADEATHVAKMAAAMLTALESPGMPKGATQSHHGLRQRLDRWYITINLPWLEKGKIAPSEAVTVGAHARDEKISKSSVKRLASALSQALGTVLEERIGRDGVSLVIERPTPPNLVRALRNRRDAVDRDHNNAFNSLWARVLRIQRRPPSELGALVGANCAGASLRTTS